MTTKERMLWGVKLLPAPPVGMAGVAIERSEILGQYKYYITYRNKWVEVTKFASKGVAGNDVNFYRRIHGVWFEITSHAAYIISKKEQMEESNGEG